MIVWIESLDSSRIHNQPRFNEVPKSWANELCLNKTLGSNIIFTLMSAPYLPIPYIMLSAGLVHILNTIKQLTLFRSFCMMTDSLT